MKKITLLSIGILFIVGFFLGYYFFKKPNLNPIFCTQEALLCLDGAFVGWQSPECIFADCPGKGPFIGILQRQQEDFRLFMMSPDVSGQEVSYSLPLKIKDESSFLQSINKRIVVYGFFDTGNTFWVDNFEVAKNPDPTTGEIKFGQSVFINGVLITLNNIVSDSRCPANAQCIWAGSVSASVSLKSDTDKDTVIIDSAKDPIGFDSFLISIIDVKPDKLISGKLDPEKYILTFKVVSR